MSDIILISDHRVLAIPTEECGEALIDLRDSKELLFGPSPEIENNLCYTKLRKQVIERLLQAQLLLPEGLRLCIYEGLRTLQLQSMLFNGHLNKVTQEYPNWSDTEIFYETTKMVAPVINLDGSTNIPPHSTGGAVDLYLVDDKGQALDMGIHPKDWIDDVGGFLSQTQCDNIGPKAKQNREILSGAMLEAGFVNMPTEYWHWSYGDRYWAFVKQEPAAIYGPLAS